MQEKIEKLVLAGIYGHIFPCAVVLIGGRNKINYIESFGNTRYDDLGTKPVKNDFIFDIASITKIFTTTAVLKLIERDTISLQTRLAEFLPQFEQKDKSQITVWNLLTHTSGASLKFHSLSDFPSKSIRWHLLNGKLLFKPGNQFHYDNADMMLLAELISLTSGKKFIDFLHDEVLLPLDLKHTLFNPGKKLLPKIVPTEESSWRMRLIHREVHDSSAYAMGGIAGHAGLFSTTEDLWKFAKMWLNKGMFGKKRYLSAELVTATTIAQFPATHVHMGLGWMLNSSHFMDHAPSGTYGHAGFTGTLLIICPSQEKIIIMLSNRVYPKLTENEAIFKFRSKLVKLLLNT